MKNNNGGNAINGGLKTAPVSTSGRWGMMASFGGFRSDVYKGIKTLICPFSRRFRNRVVVGIVHFDGGYTAS